MLLPESCSFSYSEHYSVRWFHVNLIYVSLFLTVISERFSLRRLFRVLEKTSANI